MFGKLDDYLLDKVFQPFVDWRAAKYGLTSFELAIATIEMAIASLVGYIFMDSWYRAQANNISWLGMIANLLVILFLSHFRKRMIRDSKNFNYESPTIPESRSSEFFFRVLLVLTLLILYVPEMIGDLIAFKTTIKDVMGYLYNIFLPTSFYFWACIPRPPSRETQTESTWNAVPDAT